MKNVIALLLAFGTALAVDLLDIEDMLTDVSDKLDTIIDKEVTYVTRVSVIIGKCI